MTDITLTDIGSGYNRSVINDNFTVIEDKINNDLVHNKNGNNVMEQDLDMNSNTLLNLAAPVNPNDPIRLKDLQGSVFITQYVNGMSVFLSTDYTDFDIVIIKNFIVDNTSIGSATFFATGNTGTASTTDLANGLIYDSLGKEFKIADHIVDDETFGTVSDRNTDNTTEIDKLIQYNSSSKVINRTTGHNSNTWESQFLVDSKDLSGKAMKYSLGSLPRFSKRLGSYNEANSEVITVLGIGNLLGSGYGDFTNRPAAKFSSMLNDFFNKANYLTFNLVDESATNRNFDYWETNISSLLSANIPDIVVITLGYEDGYVYNYNTNNPFDQLYYQLNSIVRQIMQYGADVVLFTTPHPLSTNTYATTIISSYPQLYPTKYLYFEGSFTFDSSTNRITCTTNPIFNNSSDYGIGVEIGKTINVSSTSNNNGDLSITGIDPSGYYVEVSGTLVNEGPVSSIVKRINIDSETEQFPPASSSFISIDALGLGAGNEIDVSVRHLKINNLIRNVGLEAGALIIDAEHYYFDAVYRNGEDAFYGLYYVPNTILYNQSFNRAMYEAIESMAESYTQNTQNKTVTPILSVNDFYSNSSTFKVKENSDVTDIVTVVDFNDNVLFNIDHYELVTSLNTTINGAAYFNDNVTFGSTVVEVIEDPTTFTKLGYCLKLQSKNTSNVYEHSISFPSIASTTQVLRQSAPDTIVVNSSGYVVISAIDSTSSNIHQVVYPFVMLSNVLTLGTAISDLNTGTAVITNVVATGQNIQITLSGTGASVACKWVELDFNL